MATVLRPMTRVQIPGPSYRMVVEAQAQVWQNALLWYLLPAPSTDQLPAAILY